jgi:hypothetical protein
MVTKNEVSSVNKVWTTEKFLEFLERLTHEERRVLACLLDDEARDPATSS